VTLTERKPIPDAKRTVKKKRKSKSKAKAKAKTKTKTKIEPVISARVKGYLEQLKTTRRHLPTVVKYLAADSFYSKKSVVDGVVDLDLHLDEYYKSRFQIEFIFRDAKQFTGLCDCQSRQQKALDFHFNTSLAALNIAKLEQQQTQSATGEDSQPQSFSMATYHCHIRLTVSVRSSCQSCQQ
jgi:hypothetical protein